MGNSESPINTEQLIPISKITESNIDYADEVVELSERAKEYLSSMPWCKEVVNGWLDYSCGYIIGVFYFELLPAQPEVPHFVWVIVGDLPPAYLDVEYCPNGREAIDGYVSEMQEWVDRVLDGRPIDETVIPVNVPPEKKWAEQLQSRLNLIREQLLDESQQDE